MDACVGNTLLWQRVEGHFWALKPPLAEADGPAIGQEKIQGAADWRELTLILEVGSNAAALVLDVFYCMGHLVAEHVPHFPQKCHQVLGEA